MDETALQRARRIMRELRWAESPNLAIEAILEYLESLQETPPSFVAFDQPGGEPIMSRKGQQSNDGEISLASTHGRSMKFCQSCGASLVVIPTPGIQQEALG